MPMYKPHLTDTPLNRVLLLECWDALSPESKGELLGQYAEIRTCPRWLVEKALGDPLPYLRYMAVAAWRWSPDDADDQAVMARVDADPSPLVRAALLRKEYGSQGLDWMHEVSQLERLVYMGRNYTISGDYLYRFITEAVGKVPEEELAELMTEYCRNPSVLESMTQSSGDGEIDWIAYSWFTKVWELVRVVPKAVYMPILWHFPTEVPRWGSVPEEVLAKLAKEDDGGLGALLWRHNARLEKLRARVAQHPEEFGEQARYGAEMFAKYARMDRQEPTPLEEQLADIQARLARIEEKRGLFW